MTHSRRYIRAILLAVIFVLINMSSHGQAPYWVYFKDKCGVNPDFELQFHHKAIERRIQCGAKLKEFNDLPVSEYYVTDLYNISPVIYGCSKWLNACLLRANDEQLRNILLLPEVQSVVPANKEPAQLFENKYSTQVRINTADESSKFLTARNKQISWLEGEEFIKRAIVGKGIRIAVFDGGFPDLDEHPGFKHLFENHQIVGTWDFAKKNDKVFKYNPHGNAVLSCVAGILDGKPTGLATGAEFLLARTELQFEPWREQLYWIQAAEWAEQNGADIITSALGYTSEHYFINEMDGFTSPVTRAANIAASKGILVINSAGNDGDNSWKYVGAPADGDSVLAVGGIDTETGYKISFSSIGPNSSGTLKPNVCAPAEVVCASKKSWKIKFGTSFSAPLVAGFAACLWSMFPEWNNMQVFRAIEEASHLYPYYDYQHGYGIPKASIALKEPANPVDTNQLKVDLYGTYLSISSAAASEIDVYFHIAFPNGVLQRYALYQIAPGETLEIDLSEIEKGSILRIRTKGAFKEITL